MVAILAHASAYYETTIECCGERMDSEERNMIMIPLMFIAHSYTMDETCPLAVWHKYLLRSYSSVSTLNSAVLRLMELRKWNLRLEEADLQMRLAVLAPGSANSYELN
jgi:hypothetical protein